MPGNRHHYQELKVMKSEVAAAKQIPTIVIAKETSRYRIITDDPDNWYLVANQSIAKTDPVAHVDNIQNIDVRGIEIVEVILEETQERKQLSTAMYAIPDDAGHAQTVLEIPWCFMNHSCEPNTRGQLDTEPFVNFEATKTLAKRDIIKGEELTYDYALKRYNTETQLECTCGSELCRGTILGFNDLGSAEQEQLLSQAMPHIQTGYRNEFILKHAETSPRGRHLLIDYWDCNTDLLNNEVELVQLLAVAAEAAGANVMSTHFHQFDHQGITAIAILAESHISIHTWPGASYAGVDIYTCGNCSPLSAHKVLTKALSAGRSEFAELVRGRASASNSISMISNGSPLRSGLEEDSTWFLEGTVPGKRHSNVSHGFLVSEVIFKERTPFQECLIFDNPVYGRVLILDGIVQLSTSDEHIYHEMIVHPPMFSHPNPKKILIVGGGDGGTLREVLRHDPLEVVMIDIDRQFVDAAAEHLPSLSNGAFEDPRVTLVFENASEALRRYENRFDVAIIDCNDAVGTSEILFEKDFYATVAHALKNDGICTVQAGSMLDEDFLTQTRLRMEERLGHTTGFRLTMPCYHCGEYVFLQAARSRDPSGPDVNKLATIQIQREIDTKHWSPEIHHASQILPPHSTLW